MWMTREGGHEEQSGAGRQAGRQASPTDDERRDELKTVRRWQLVAANTEICGTPKETWRKSDLVSARKKKKTWDTCGPDTNVSARDLKVHPPDTKACASDTIVVRQLRMHVPADTPDANTKTRAPVTNVCATDTTASTPDTKTCAADVNMHAPDTKACAPHTIARGPDPNTCAPATKNAYTEC